MSSKKPRLAAVLATLVLVATIGTSTASAAPTFGDKQWNELFPTTGLSWAQVASVCPTDGATPCNGTVGGRNLTGWVWATSDQVLELMENYAPGISTGDYTNAGFGAAIGFLNDFRWTTYTALTYFYTEYTDGWTASRDANDLPISGSASFQTPFFAGGIGVGSGPDQASPYRGVFLWRTAGLDYTPPVVTPTISGTLGNNGWYRSNIGVSWTVTDPESAIVSTQGCGPSSVGADTVSTSFTCVATSAGLGGPASATAAVKRDATAPAVTCGPTPTFALTQFPAYVTATVTDATSGVTSASLSALVNTNAVGAKTATLTGTDNAGNTTTRSCPYNVSGPLCKGKPATIVGTAASETINGTSGADVIVGLYGADTIYGKGGNDTICGGDNPDVIYGDAGKDVIDGGEGDDDLYGGGGDDDIDGGAHYDSIRGDDGADRCTSGERRMSSCAVIY